MGVGVGGCFLSMGCSCRRCTGRRGGGLGSGRSGSGFRGGGGSGTGVVALAVVETPGFFCFGGRWRPERVVFEGVLVWGGAAVFARRVGRRRGRRVLLEYGVYVSAEYGAARRWLGERPERIGIPGWWRFGYRRRRVGGGRNPRFLLLWWPLAAGASGV